MAEPIEQQNIDGGDWPKLPAHKDPFNSRRTVHIYYYKDENTGEMDADRTLRTMFWLFNEDYMDANEVLSVYMSILNVFTYPEFEKIAPNLPNLVGIKLQPTPFTDIDRPWLGVIPDLHIPLSADDMLLSLAVYVLLLDFIQNPSIMDAARDMCAEVGAFPSKLFHLSKLNKKNCAKTTDFMADDSYLAFRKHIYDCLLQKADTMRNQKAEALLNLCGEYLPEIEACEKSFIN